MKKRFRNRSFTLVNEILSFVLAASIIIFSISAVYLACFSSEGLEKKKLQAYSAQTIECVNSRLEELADATGFPSEVYTNCFDENSANLVFDTVVYNLKYSYPTIFSDNEQLYEIFKKNITNYCYNNSINISNKEISNYSALAIDAVNETLGGYSTSSIGVTKAVKSNAMIALIVVPVILIIASMVLIDLLNNGRHRRLNFYGMGVSTAGTMITLGSMLAIFKDYAHQYQFCENVIYDAAIGDIVNIALKICATIGIICFIIGFVLLINNYFYFRKKKLEQDANREEKMQNILEYDEVKFQNEEHYIK